MISKTATNPALLKAVGAKATARAMLLIFLLFSSVRVKAQIVPDGTLPNNSRVSPASNTSIIDGGTDLEGNLLHSFQEFSLPAGSEAFFNNALDIQNIIARVTGGLPSNIDGLIRANGSANLFLLNPAGIMFGPNARLDIGGSLVASSANSIVFNDGSRFSAKDPSEIPLLTINVPIGLQYGENSGEIRVEGTGSAAELPTENMGENIGLAVAPGKTLALVGGDVSVRGSTLTAPSGRIEIGSVGLGEASLTSLADGGWRLGYEGVSEFGEIQLLEQSILANPNQSNNPEGGIAVRGNKITLNQSQIVGTNQGAVAGAQISLDASESIEISGVVSNALSSSVTNQVEPGASGAGGSIAVTTPQLTIRDGGRIQTLSFGSGAAGNVTVNASEIMLSGFFPLGLFQLEKSPNTRIASENFSLGAGGDVSVTAQRLTLLDGGQVGTEVRPLAEGNGGNIIVVASDITAINSNPFDPLLPSGIFTNSLGAGDGGEIAVSTERLTLQEGARIQSFGQGTGIGGDIAVNATESISGEGFNPIVPALPSGILAITSGPASGGSLNISTERLVFGDGANMGSFVILQAFQQPPPGAGVGNAGDVTVVAGSSVELSGASSLAPDNFSGIFSMTFGSGNAGNVNLSTKRLTIRNGGSLSSLVAPPGSSLGQPRPGGRTGLGGNVSVDASESIEVIGTNPFIATASFVGTFTAGSGDAGSTIINTPRLILLDGGRVESSTASTGNAGRITINASDSILVSGADPENGELSQVSARTQILEEALRESFLLQSVPSGDTGEVIINANRLEVRDKASITVQHDGTGNAGRLQLNAGDVVLDGGSNITASTALGLGGNSTLDVSGSLQLRNGSQITVESLGGTGSGGNLTVNAPIVAVLENSEITANAVGGRGGNIQINASGIFLSVDSPVTASSQLGVDGIVQINTPEFDPNSGLVELPQNLVDPSEQIVSGCAADEGNEFTLAGRGGLPPNPTTRLHSPFVWEDLRSLPDLPGSSASSPNSFWQPEADTLSARKPLVEATGWVRDSSGQVWLVAARDESRPRELQNSPECGDLK